MEQNEILQTFLVTIIQVLLPIVLGLLAAWIKSQWSLTKAQIPAENLAFAEALVSQLVLAAEQNGLTQALKSEGVAKKDWVITRAQEELEERGIKISVKVLSDLIESIVYQEFTVNK